MNSQLPGCASTIFSNILDVKKNKKKEKEKSTNYYSYIKLKMTIYENSKNALNLCTLIFKEVIIKCKIKQIINKINNYQLCNFKLGIIKSNNI